MMLSQARIRREDHLKSRRETLADDLGQVRSGQSARAELRASISLEANMPNMAYRAASGSF
jgi:hypothetical protein